jgi:hypothetical protein
LRRDWSGRFVFVLVCRGPAIGSPGASSVGAANESPSSGADAVISSMTNSSVASEPCCGRSGFAVRFPEPRIRGRFVRIRADGVRLRCVARLGFRNDLRPDVEVDLERWLGLFRDVDLRKRRRLRRRIRGAQVHEGIEHLVANPAAHPSAR